MRTERFKDIIKDKDKCKVGIYGVGAIGRQIALQLAAMGVNDITIMDHDVVEDHNLGPQAYKEFQVGMEKVSATFDDMTDLNPHATIRTKTTDEYEFEVVFLCVDTVKARDRIVKQLNPDVLVFDTRMSANTVIVVQETGDEYIKTLPTKPTVGRCTSRSTLYGASLAASAAVGFWMNDVFRNKAWLHDCVLGTSKLMNIDTFCELVKEPEDE